MGARSDPPGETVIEVCPEIANLDVEKYRSFPAVLQHAFQGIW